MAGEEGFEPPYDGFRARCLTAWRLPNGIALASTQLEAKAGAVYNDAHQVSSRSSGILTIVRKRLGLGFRPMAELIEQLVLHPRVWLTLHVLGVCVGLGGATITDVLFFKFLKDFRISNKEADVMRTLSHVIIGALVLILLSGMALYAGDMAKYNMSHPFIAKMIIVLVLTINGMVLHEYVSPKLVRLSFAAHHHPTPKLRALRHLAFALGAVSATSWYFTFFLAMLKTLLPDGILAYQILTFYAAAVFLGVSVSQFIEHRLHLDGSIYRKARG
jgi:uncharacterized membrane protein